MSRSSFVVTSASLRTNLRTHASSIVVGSCLAVVAIVISASAALSQCDYEHPKKANKVQASFVQAFVPCGGFCVGGPNESVACTAQSACPSGACIAMVGGFPVTANEPNAVTEDGRPSCSPAETFSVQAGYTDGWRWDQTSGQGQLQLKQAKKIPISPFNPVGNTSDVSVTVKLKGVLGTFGQPANGSGGLYLLIRPTFNDRNNGYMTLTDFQANFPLPMNQGKSNIKTSVDVLLNAMGKPGLPPCTSLEIVAATIVDQNGNTFANVGLFAP